MTRASMDQTDVELPRSTLSDVLGALDPDAQAEVAGLDPHVTIRARSSSARAPSAALDTLRASVASADASARVARLHELGRGGMGVVHLAEQRALGREVAIKEMREDTRGRAAAESLLQEAWVLGAIEHPNVVPVYDLMLNEHGHPIVILKRIEGESWEQLIDDPERVRAQYGANQVLEWHLGVLLQVCNAVSFAHSRGLVHRDIKPENVMIGRFGEVYLVDWGVAVALTDDGSGRFPLARDVQTFAGTPRYMAPEMLGGRAAHIGVHTDVYLLGATLFHVLAGRAPHLGDTIVEIATRLSVKDPALPSGVPARLAEICRTAMAREAADRYPSADALRAALSEYLRQRDALLLVEEGEAKLAELVALAAAPSDDRDAHRLRMFNLYSESRLGFRLAERLLPDSAEVEDGLARVGESMIAYLLDRGEIASATTIVGQLTRPLRPDLLARYEASKQADLTHKRRLVELEALGREHDPAIGRRARLVAYTTLAALFVIGGLVAHVAHPWETHGGVLALSFGQLALLALIGAVGRRVLLSTTLNRELYFAVLIGFVGKILVHAAIALEGQPPAQGYPLVGVVFATAASTMALRHQPLLWIVAAAFAAAALTSAVWPEARYLLFAGASFVMLLVLLLAHRLEARMPERSPKRVA